MFVLLRRIVLLQRLDQLGEDLLGHLAPASFQIGEAGEPERGLQVVREGVEGAPQREGVRVALHLELRPADADAEPGARHTTVLRHSRHQNDTNASVPPMPVAACKMAFSPVRGVRVRAAPAGSDWSARTEPPRDWSVRARGPLRGEVRFGPFGGRRGLAVARLKTSKLYTRFTSLFHIVTKSQVELQHYKKGTLSALKGASQRKDGVGSSRRRRGTGKGAGCRRVCRLLERYVGTSAMASWQKRETEAGFPYYIR